GASPLFGGPASAGATVPAVVDFQNGLDLGGLNRTISVSDRTAGGGSLARVSGPIVGGSGTTVLTVQGPTGIASNLTPTLELSGTITYSGSTVVSSATLRAADGVGLPAASNLTLSSG